MSSPATIRERFQRATAYFRNREGVVLTTFNLSGTFLEDQALPTVLGVEAKTAATQRAELHQRLATTPCTIFYDPATAPRISGKFRYVARPIPLRGRCFHPKLVVIAGRSENEITWVYVAVSSANLTLSGWGRNVESFGETWIHTRTQQTWRALDGLLEWLQNHSPLGEERTGNDGVGRIREALARMPARRRFSDKGTEPWAGALNAHLYSSVVDGSGLPRFLQLGRVRKPSELWAYSPYWADVPEIVSAFDARRTVLVPGRTIDGSALSLSREQVESLADKAEIRRNPEDIGDRFWHMKAYRIRHGKANYTAVGSCNFTHSGVAGEEGNVEAMLVFRAGPHWLPEGEATTPEDLSQASQPEEDVPTPAPVAIVVAYDWQRRSWRWYLDAGSGQHSFSLKLPSLAPFSIEHGTGERSEKPPERGSRFIVTYRNSSGKQSWQGEVVELNLDYSSRIYGKPLSAAEILESWRGRAPTWDLGHGGDDGSTDGDEDEVETEVPAAFDAVNLYDLYRSLRALRAKLGGLCPHPDVQRALLVGRPDSVMALAHLADRDGTAPVVRYLVLIELSKIATRWAKSLGDDLTQRITEMALSAKGRTYRELRNELQGDDARAREMLSWFEVRLGGIGEAAT